MAEEYLGGTTSVTSIQFAERKKYLDYVNSSEVNFLNTIYEKKLYGFVNKAGDAVVPVENLRPFGEYAGAIEGLSFVVSIFNKFRDFYMELQRSTNIKTPALLEGLIPSKSYVSFEQTYENYIRIVANQLSSFLVSKGYTSYMTFEKFIDIVNEALFHPNNMKYRVSKTGFALSDSSSVHHTGLYIDLGKGYDPNTDSLKVELVADPDFFCYAKYAQSFGFNVDFNCPWRLAIDLDAQNVQDDILNNRAGRNFYDIYSDLYTLKLGYDDFWAVQSFYELFYVQWCVDINVERIPEVFSQVPIEKTLEYFLLTRFRELGLLSPQMRDSTLFRETLAKVLDINRLFGLGFNGGAIAFINKYCSDVLKLILKGSTSDDITNAGL